MLVGIVAGQDAPAATSRPDGTPLYSLACEIYTGCARRIDIVDLGRPSTCIHEDTALLVSRFQPVGDAYTEHPFFIVIEDGLIESLERSDLIDDASALPSHKYVAGGVFQNLLAFAGYPERLDNKLSLVGSALGRDYLFLIDRYLLRAALRFVL